jgi:hypothetical protein
MVWRVSGWSDPSLSYCGGPDQAYLVVFNNLGMLWSRGKRARVTPVTRLDAATDIFDTRYSSYASISDHDRPSSLQRTPSPGYSSSSHSHTRSLPHIGVNITSPTSLASSLSSQANDRMRHAYVKPHPPASSRTAGSSSTTRTSQEIHALFFQVT